VPIGSNFDDFLQEQGIYELCTAAANYLDDDATTAVYLAAAKAYDNPAICVQAVIDVAHARKAVKLAKTAAY
jgi:DNA-binding phage protein